jgi:hypothetical protein
LPAARWSLALGSVLLFLVACGNPDTGGAVIGARTNADASVATASFDASGIAAKFEADLAQLNRIQSIGETTLANGELPIDSILTFRQSLQLSYLQILGNTLISERLNAISIVRGQVVSDGAMAYWQKNGVTGSLDASTAALAQLQLTIAREQLVDRARHDIFKIGQLRVYGLVLPKARLLIAAYQLNRLGSIYTSQQAALQQQIYAAQAYGKDATAAQVIVNDLSRRVATVTGSYSAALAQLQGLNPSGYPANKHSLTSARSSLVTGKLAADQAAADVARARAAIP